MKCPKCGTDHNENTVFCSNCGEKLIHEGQNEQQNQSQATYAPPTQAVPQVPPAPMPVKEGKGTVLLVFSCIFGGLFTLLGMIAFLSGEIIPGCIALAQILLLMLTMLIKRKVIKLPINGIHIITFILSICMIVPFLATFGIEPKETAEWEELVLSSELPEPQEDATIEVIINDLDTLSIKLEDISAVDYKSYIAKCEEMGYTLDVDDSIGYKAFNEKGYNIDVSLILDIMYVTLKAPQKYSEISWPTSGISSLLPVPNSNKGTIINDKSDKFSAYISDMDKDAFKTYVNDCISNGFDVDYTKGETDYKASDASGNSIHIKYEGGNVVYIYITAPEEEEADLNSILDVFDDDDFDFDTDDDTESDEASSEKETTTNIDSQDFKKAMDEYEEFFEKYVDFMKEYKKSGNSLTMYSEYIDMFAQYTETMTALSKIKEDELSPSDAAYYTKVMERINRKLLEIQS